MNFLRKAWPLLVLIGLGLALLFSGALDRFRPEHLAASQAHLQLRIAAHPLLAGLTHIAAMTLAIATGIPALGFICALAGGMLFGVPIGATLSLCGLVLGSTALFLASRRAFGEPGQSAGAPGLAARLHAGYLAQPVSYTFFLRLVPFFPFGAVTLALAWLRCPLWLFVAATAFGGLAMTGIETWLGASLAKNIGANKAVGMHLLNDPSILLPMFGMAALALVPVLVNQLRGGKTTTDI